MSEFCLQREELQVVSVSFQSWQSGNCCFPARAPNRPRYHPAACEHELHCFHVASASSCSYATKRLGHFSQNQAGLRLKNPVCINLSLYQGSCSSYGFPPK